jgi:glycosyltransferase 2 family protein
MSFIRNASRFLGPLVVGVAFVLLGVLVFRQWDSLQQYELQIRPKWLLASAVFIITGWVIEILMWRRTLGLLDGHLDSWTAMRVWFTSSIVRYIPGNVWQPFSLTVLCREHGIRAEATLASFSLFQVVHVLSVGLIAAVYLAVLGRPGAQPSSIGTSSLWWALAAALPVVLFLWRPDLILAVANFALRKLGREPLPLNLSTGELLKLSGISLTAWACFCAGFATLAGSLLTSGSFWQAAPHLIGAYPIAYVVGFVSFLTPSGLVVREGMLFLLLSPVIGKGDAVVIPIAMRAWEIGLDAVVTGSVIGVGWVSASSTKPR